MGLCGVGSVELSPWSWSVELGQWSWVRGVGPVELDRVELGLSVQDWKSYLVEVLT